MRGVDWKRHRPEYIMIEVRWRFQPTTHHQPTHLDCILRATVMIEVWKKYGGAEIFAMMETVGYLRCPG